MTRTIVTACLLAATAWLVPALGEEAALDKARDQLIQLEHDWAKAYVKRDTDFFETLLADKYVFTTPDGMVNDKKADIGALKDGTIAFDEMKMSDLKVQVHGGTTAVVTGKAAVKGKVGGQDATGDYRFTDVFVKTGDGWKCVAAQATRIGKQ